jgi:carbonic anhydrase/acetyltransferase-like protein (isoleucine patch superfamily)
VGVAKDIYVGTTATIAGITFHNNTTPTLASATAGAVQTTGGVGIAKDLYVGTTATLAGSLAVTGFSSLSGGATLSAATVTNALVVTGYTSLNGGATISAATVTNTLSVTGRTSLTDVNVSQTLTATNLVVSGTATLPSTVTLSNLTVTNLTVTNNETVGNNLSVANLFTSTGAATFGSTIGVTGIATFNSTQDSNATNNGSIVTLGGVGIAKNLVVGTAVTVGSASTQTVVPAIYSNNSLYSSYTSGYITTNSVISLDTYSASAYRTAKYIVQIVDGTKIHVEEILVFHDGTNVYLTEYAIATSQGELGTFDASLGGGTVTVNFTANYTPTSMTIKLNRTTITL